jgi:hypothetical protein
MTFLPIQLEMDLMLMKLFCRFDFFGSGPFSPFDDSCPKAILEAFRNDLASAFERKI